MVEPLPSTCPADDCASCPITGERDMLFSVSQILAQSVDLRKTLCHVLQELENRVQLSRGIVTLLDPESGDLVLEAMINADGSVSKPSDVRYKSGEGILG